MNEIELKPCPFCGGEAKIVQTMPCGNRTYRFLLAALYVALKCREMQEREKKQFEFGTGGLKMNDSKIIKALTTSSDPNNLNCQPTTKLCKEALDLIKRQQEEIDRLNIDLKAMRGAANSWKAEVQRICKREFDNIEIDIEAVKSEAVREFAERLKEKLKANSNYGDIYDVVAYDCIDKLMEEMGCNDEL